MKVFFFKEVPHYKRARMLIGNYMNGFPQLIFRFIGFKNRMNAQIPREATIQKYP